MVEQIRVGVIGARRRRQGIGEHVARKLAALGADVCAVLGTSPASAQETADYLLAQYGLHVAGYSSLEEMIARERLDALAICSPFAVHREQLALAAQAGLHVLCEKPLVFEEGRDPAADAAPLVEAFNTAGRVLMVNEQWPFTLSTYDQLFAATPAPDRAASPRTLSMLLGPHAIGPRMVVDALPHVVSLLLARAPAGGHAEDIQIHIGESAGGQGTLDLAFDYVHRRGRVGVTAHFRCEPMQPRPAGYAFDGRAVRRVIHRSDYRMELEALPPEQSDFTSATWSADAASPALGARLALADPLELLLAEFLKRVAAPTHNDAASIVTSLALLRDVERAAQRVWSA